MNAGRIEYVPDFQSRSVHRRLTAQGAVGSHCACCRRESQRQVDSIARDGLMCEAHPGLEFEHDPNCAGPGMPWEVSGREAIENLKAQKG